MSACNIARLEYSVVANVNRIRGLRGFTYIQAGAVHGREEGRQHLVNSGRMKKAADILGDVSHVPGGLATSEAAMSEAACGAPTRTHLISNWRLVRKRSLLRILYIGIQGSLMSLTDSFFLERHSTCRPSEQAAMIWLGMPGVVHTWKYILMSAMRFSFGMGYFNMDQLRG